MELGIKMILSKMARNEIWVLVWMYLVSTTAEGPRCPQGATTEQCREDRSVSYKYSYFYTVKGVKLRVSYGPTHYYLTCPDNFSLEYEAIPRFETAVNVSNVQLKACAPPPHGYAAALRTLGVSPRRLVLELLPARPALTVAHLRDLTVDELILSAPERVPLLFDSASVESLANLSTLRLTNMSLTHEALLLLPPTLHTLSLVDVGIAKLPAEVFGRLPALTYFQLTDANVRELNLSEAVVLRFVSLEAPIAVVTLGPSVVNVTLSRVRSGALIGNCSSLERVDVNIFTEPLPARWLAACPAVREVHVNCGRPVLLRADLLVGARALRDLTVAFCGLHELPPQWLTEAPALVALDLSFNKLQRLPRSLASAAALERVRLVGNQLSATALEALGALPVLRHLSLGWNPLGDLCGSDRVFDANELTKDNVSRSIALSPLWRARGLRMLSLANTSLTRICRDWRTELEWLTDLDLSYNLMSLLEFDDLQWRRRKATLVNLSGNPVRGVHYTREQFAAVLAGNVSSDFASFQMTTLVLKPNSLQCDCTSYWFVRATRERPQHARAALQNARCRARSGAYAALEETDPHVLQCPLPPDAVCPAGCTCSVIGEHSELSCERANLTRVPRAPPGLPALALLLPHNNISVLTSEDFTSDLEVLDLSDNLIASVDAATMAALLGSPRIVCLAGNPLRCDTLPLLRALGEHVVPRAGSARDSCWGGSDALGMARELAQRCEFAVWPYAVAAVTLIAVSAVATGCLIRPATRQRFQRFLFERGLCLRWLLRPLRASDDAELPYDAFVSFSHRDASFAMELTRRLERGAALRLCLHERDWIPGEWIPAQIARSVRESRRTLVLLSESLLSSTWARAELRAAYGVALCEQRPRLLLVLLPGMSPERAAAADPELRAYIASVTYLRWDDPHFWDKLILAMPRSRAPPVPEATEPPAEPGPLASPAEPELPHCA